MTEKDVDAKTVIDLRAFAVHLRGTGAQITAAQLDHALNLVERSRSEREEIVALIEAKREQVRHDDRDGAMLLEEIAREIEAGKHAEAPRSRPPLRRIDVLEFVQELLDDRDVGLNRDHTIKDLMDHIDGGT